MPLLVAHQSTLEIMWPWKGTVATPLWASPGLSQGFFRLHKKSS